MKDHKFLGIPRNENKLIQKELKAKSTSTNNNDCGSIKTTKKEIGLKNKPTRGPRNIKLDKKSKLSWDLEVFKKKIKTGTYQLIEEQKVSPSVIDSEQLKKPSKTNNKSFKPHSKMNKQKPSLVENELISFEVEFRLKCILYNSNDDETPYFKIKEAEINECSFDAPTNSDIKQKPENTFEQFLIQKKGITLEEWRNLDKKEKTKRNYLPKQIKEKLRRAKTEEEEVLDLSNTSEKFPDQELKQFKNQSFGFNESCMPIGDISFKKSADKANLEEKNEASNNLIDFDLKELDIPEQDDLSLIPMKSRASSSEKRRLMNKGYLFTSSVEIHSSRVADKA